MFAICNCRCCFCCQCYSYGSTWDCFSNQATHWLNINRPTCSSAYEWMNEQDSWSWQSSYCAPSSSSVTPLHSTTNVPLLTMFVHLFVCCCCCCCHPSRSYEKILYTLRLPFACKFVSYFNFSLFFLIHWLTSQPVKLIVAALCCCCCWKFQTKTRNKIYKNTCKRKTFQNFWIKLEVRIGIGIGIEIGFRFRFRFKMLQSNANLI